MEINWFTVIAQIVNFLILVWLLKRFLYKPVLNAVDEREKKISGQLAHAEATKKAAIKEQERFMQKNELFEQERAAKMKQVLEEIDAEKTRLFTETRKESDALRTKYEASLQEQQKSLAETVRQRTTEEVFAIAGKTLEDLANANLEEQVVAIFMEKIRALEPGQKEELSNALNENKKAVSIKSAFELSPKSKKELARLITGITGQQNQFSYLLVPALVSGISIDTENYQLSWNIDSYLNSLRLSITPIETEHAIN